MIRKRRFPKVLLLMAILLVVSIFAAKLFWTFLISSPSNNKNTEVFSIKPGESTEAIVKRLEKEGFIRNELAFKVLLKISGFSGKIQAGDFSLSREMNAREVVNALTHGVFDSKLTFIEGWRKEEMADLVFRELKIPRAEFLKYSEEGKMFPDTYFVPKNISAEELAKILKDNFEDKFSAELQKEAKRKGLTKEEVVILASIIERESRSEEERPIIAGILMKRWNNDIALEADATVQYALGYQPASKTWWKETLTAEDLSLDSPYNTRKNLGLPPGPICNPSLSSMKAVIYPKQSPYLYYAHDKKGSIYYAQTLEEHNANVAKFLN